MTNKRLLKFLLVIVSIIIYISDCI